MLVGYNGPQKPRLGAEAYHDYWVYDMELVDIEGRWIITMRRIRTLAFKIGKAELAPWTG